MAEATDPTSNTATSRDGNDDKQQGDGEDVATSSATGNDKSEKEAMATPY